MPSPDDSSFRSQPVGEDELVALRAIVEGTAGAHGEGFFQSLVQRLAEALRTGYAMIAEFAGEGRARTIAYWTPTGLTDNVEWELAGTPCAEVVEGRLCHHPTGVMNLFPADEFMVDNRIESYLGVPLRSPAGQHLGHLAVFDARKMPPEPRNLFIFRIFAARAAAELERLRMEKMLADSERRFRDLYEEAPIAYVHEDLTSRFISANHAALRILGLKREEVPGFVGASLVPQTPDAQRRLRQAFEAIGQGTDTSGVVLELTRKDDGKPLWIQWWSRPDPDGKYTRTMFIDITERVLMEQEKARVEAQNLYLQEEINSSHNFEEIIGQSPALLAVLDQVQRVAATDASVLVTGETGTGKELIARAIHSASKRRDKPLIKVNCAALPAGLVESELFGHEKGAFSGAIARRIGRFELASGGTLFLDEVGELPADVQVKLLRVLQEREFERVGGSASIKADVRVIAATNRDLQKAIAAGAFRQDLFYRLNVFPVHLPALRQRVADVPLLVRFLVDKFAARTGRRIDSVANDTLDRLKAYRWPGNVRELENVLERAVILCTGTTLSIGPELLPSESSPAPVEVRPPTSPIAAGPGTSDATTPEVFGLEDLERNHIINVLRQTRWVIEGPNGAARLLDVHPNTLRSRLKRLGISRQTHDIS